MNNYNAIKLEIANRVATITFNRPDAANGLNLEMATELAQAAELVAQNSDLKAAVLTGSGRFFCAGGDVKSMYDAKGSAGAAVRQIADQLHHAISIFSRMQIPLICVVNGTAAGAGFSLAVSADMVIAVDSAKFTMAYSNIGLSPDGSASYYLPRLIGTRKTQELMLTNRVLSAAEAQQWGLVNYVVSADEVSETLNPLLEQFINGSRSSTAAIKQLLLVSAVNDLDQQLQIESQTIADCADANDGQEGVAAFIEKRKAEFE